MPPTNKEEEKPIKEKIIDYKCPYCGNILKILPSQIEEAENACKDVHGLPFKIPK